MSLLSRLRNRLFPTRLDSFISSVDTLGRAMAQVGLPSPAELLRGLVERGRGHSDSDTRVAGRILAFLQHDVDLELGEVVTEGQRDRLNAIRELLRLGAWQALGVPAETAAWCRRHGLTPGRYEWLRGEHLDVVRSADRRVLVEPLEEREAAVCLALGTPAAAGERPLTLFGRRLGDEALRAVVRRRVCAANDEGAEE